MLTIAADPKRLVVYFGFTSCPARLAPHVHMIVPVVDIARRHTLDALPAISLAGEGPSRLFRRLTLEMLLAAHDAGRLQVVRRSRSPRQDYEDPRRVKGKGG